MTTIRNFTLTLLLLSPAAPLTPAQERADVRQSAAAHAVTVSTSDKGVRFVALGSVRQLRLEVFGEGGDSLYNSGFQSGNVRDWNLEDRQGLPMPDGAYLCVITFCDVAGRVGMKQGKVLLRSGRAQEQLHSTRRRTPSGLSTSC